MFIGLVGKPSAGKSTFFKALTLMDIPAANFPFTTIEPNEGIAFVRVDCVGPELGRECTPREGKCVDGKRFVPVKVLDVAGLVPGAHEGKGLGLEFLNDLSPADALIHVVDVSGSLNENGEPVETGSYDPARDIEFLERELDMWYLSIVKRLESKWHMTEYRNGERVMLAIAKQFSGLRVTEDMVKRSMVKLALMDKHVVEWTEDDFIDLVRSFRLETKPMMIAANKADVPGADEKLKKLKEKFPHLIIIPCSAESELALKEADKKDMIDYIPGEGDFAVKEGSGLNEQQKKGLAFIKRNVLDRFGSTGVQDVINAAVFSLLEYIAIFPGGVNKLEDSEGRVLPDCFLVPPGTTALEFAYRLHTDLGDHFIRAVDVKKKLAVKKEHELKHRDVIEIVHDR